VPACFTSLLSIFFIHISIISHFYLHKRRWTPISVLNFQQWQAHLPRLSRKQGHVDRSRRLGVQHASTSIQQGTKMSIGYYTPMDSFVYQNGGLFIIHYISIFWKTPSRSFTDPVISHRLRRVKCDETKPSCLRCRNFGRKCDGYEYSPKVGSRALAIELISLAYLLLGQTCMAVWTNHIHWYNPGVLSLSSKFFTA
jgi:hypothetical protein